jgi:hypothetical protein
MCEETTTNCVRAFVVPTAQKCNDHWDLSSTHFDTYIST